MEENIQQHHYQSGIEALLFVSDKPITLEQFRTVFPELKPAQIAELVKAVQDEYVARNGGIVIVEIAGGWQMLSNSHAAGYIRAFYKTHSKEKLSKPALEALAIVAYKQPVGRAEVEVIRGVNSDGTLAHLLNKGLIEIVGRKEVPGRPFLYGTTKMFLDYFGLRSLDGLPKIEELANLNLEALAATAQVAKAPESETSALANAEASAAENTTASSGEVDAAGDERQGLSSLPVQEQIETDRRGDVSVGPAESGNDENARELTAAEKRFEQGQVLPQEDVLQQEPSGQSRLDHGIETTAQ